MCFKFSWSKHNLDKLKLWHISLPKFKNYLCSKKTFGLAWFCLSNGLNLWFSQNSHCVVSARDRRGQAHLAAAQLTHATQQWWERSRVGGMAWFSFLSAIDCRVFHLFYAIECQLACQRPSDAPNNEKRQETRAGRVGTVLNMANKPIIRKPQLAQKRYVFCLL